MNPNLKIQRKCMIVQLRRTISDSENTRVTRDCWEVHETGLTERRALETIAEKYRVEDFIAVPYVCLEEKN